jgi:hypothetical protein
VVVSSAEIRGGFLGVDVLGLMGPHTSDIGSTSVAQLGRVGECLDLGCQLDFGLLDKACGDVICHDARCDTEIPHLHKQCS